MEGRWRDSGPLLTDAHWEKIPPYDATSRVYTSPHD
jgi:hypothetical protein